MTPYAGLQAQYNAISSGQVVADPELAQLLRRLEASLESISGKILPLYNRAVPPRPTDAPPAALSATPQTYEQTVDRHIAHIDRLDALMGEITQRI